MTVLILFVVRKGERNSISKKTQRQAHMLFLRPRRPSDVISVIFIMVSSNNKELILYDP